MEKRVTIHNARSGKHGVFKVKHNDRTYQEKPIKTNNRYWHISKDKSLTFEQVEMDFYERHFSKSLAKQNAKYEKKRNYSRMKSMEDYYTNKRTCPEETLFYIGKMNNSAPDSDLWKIVREQLAWEQKTFPQAKILDFALHTDEKGAPHIHSRKVWIAHDEDGNEIVSQEQALAEMGIQPPKPGKKVDRYNNAKQTYSKAVRDHFMALCKQHGYEIIEEPKEPGKSGLTHFQYILQDTQEQAKQIIEKAKQEAQEQEKQIIEKAKQEGREILEYMYQEAQGQGEMITQNALRKADEILKDAQRNAQRKEDFLEAQKSILNNKLDECMGIYSKLSEKAKYDVRGSFQKMLDIKNKTDQEDAMRNLGNTATWEDVMPPGR